MTAAKKKRRRRGSETASSEKPPPRSIEPGEAPPRAAQAEVPPQAERPVGRAAWPHLAGLALILIAAAMLYLPTLDQPFFADDYLFLDQVRNRPLHTALVTPDPLSNFYRPVSRQLYFWLVSHASGESEVAYHATSIVMFLIVLALFFVLVHRLVGPNVGLIATGFLALHYAPDVAVRWASGSQELLAVAWALAAIILHLSGRRWWAAVAMTLAALSKEIVLLTPFIIVALDRQQREPWVAAIKRAWPMAISLGIWVLLWIVMPQRRAQQGTEVEIDPLGPIAVLGHLVQVALGAEWRSGELLHAPKVLPPLVPLALVLAAIAGAWWWHARSKANAESSEPAEDRRLIVAGIGWAVLGTAPVAAVSILWSAYYFMFAMCGVGLALAVWLATKPRWWSLAAIALLAWSSASSRALNEFAVERSPWTPQSHINQYYIGRATRYVGSYLEDLKRMYPEFPQGSTLFHMGIQRNVAFQVADGPLVRWAYRDTSLRSYFMSSFGRDKLGRGPLYFFYASGDTLNELEPGEDRLYRIALGLLLNDRPGPARDALMLDREQGEKSEHASYLLAWVLWELGERESIAALLEEAGVQPQAGDVRADVERALAAFQAGDTLVATAIVDVAVRENGLDSGAHALSADLKLLREPKSISGTVEAYAARVLAPGEATMWKRWGLVLAHANRYVDALQAFERYFELGGEDAAKDIEAQSWARRLRERLADNVMGGGRDAE